MAYIQLKAKVGNKEDQFLRGLTHYSPVLLFYTKGFLMFSGGIEKQHQAVMT